MALVRSFIELITTQPGALVYHLVILFAIQLILGVTIGHWRRRRDGAAARLLVMGVGFFLARVTLMLVGVLGNIGLVSPPIVLPPLERSLHLTTTLLVIWAFLLVLRRNRRLGTFVILLATVLAAGTYAVSAYAWPAAEAQGMAYTDHWQEQVWGLSTTVVLGLAFIASLIWRGVDWGWLTCLLGIWLTGHALQLLTPVTGGHTAGWVRLADLAALPLLAALVYRRALAAPTPHQGEEAPAEALGILEAVRRIEADGDLKAGLDPAASAVAQIVNANMAAIGLMVPGPVKALRIIALHPTTSVMAAHQEPTLLLNKHPLLAVASRNRQLERVPGERGQALRVNGLYRRLGFRGSGPLLIQPLSIGDETLGLMLVGNPESGREYSPRDERIVQTVGHVLAYAIGGRQEEKLVSEEAFVHAREEAQRLADRVENLKVKLEQRQRRCEALSTQLGLREREIVKLERASAALPIWREEVRELAEARETLQVELLQWERRAERLKQANSQLKQRLEEAGPRLSASADGRVGGIVVGDDQGSIILASRSIPGLLERTREDLMATPIRDLFDEPWWMNTVDRLLKNGAQPGDVTTVSLELGERIVRVELTRLPPNENWPGRLVALFYLAKGATVERAMVGSLIQELRTPMTSIMGYTDLLLGEKLGILGESQRRLLLRVGANIERMERLLDDLIKATDIDAGQVTLLPEPVAVDEIIEDALQMLSARFDEKDLDVEVEVPPDLPPAHSDRDSLQQIVLNLLSNAALCSEPGTEIRVAAQVEGRPNDLEELPPYLLVSVTDTGGGIAPEDQRRVFRRFYRADTPLIPGVGDTGVGLSVAKALVEANDGRIWVESEMGAGSTFSFILPLSRQTEASGANGE